VNPIAELSDSFRGWAEILRGKAEAGRYFQLRGTGPLVAYGWLLVAVLLSVAAQSAAVGGVPSLVQLLLGLVGQAITVGLLALVMAQTLHFIKLQIPLNVLLIPIVYALSYMFVVSVPLTLLGPYLGALAVLAVGFLIYKLVRVAAGMAPSTAIAFAVLCVIVLVVVPNALYILSAAVPTPA
jgi:hypothetical protein